MIAAHITDPDILRAISPADVAIYLSSRGWMSEDVAGGTLWTFEDKDDSAQIFLPTSNAMRGYVGFMRDALGTLSEIEDRSEFSVLEQINCSLRDIQHVKTQPFAEPATIPLIDGAQVFDSVRQWVSAAAVSVARRRPTAVQPRRKPTEVVEFLRSVRLGSAFPGSFGISVQIPVPPKVPQLFLGVDHPALAREAVPFERRVSIRLHEATEAAVHAADRVLHSAEDIDTFVREVPHGVSAELCESLAGLGGESGHPFSISFRWATARPMDQPDDIVVSTGQIRVLREAADLLRQVQPEEDVSLIGNVVRLHREGSVGRGEVSILGSIKGDAVDRMQRVWVELDEPDYRLATAAHRGGALVSVQGNLEWRGNRAVLQDVRGFGLLGELDD